MGLVFCSFRRRRGVYACWLKINSSMARIIKKVFQNIGFSKKLTFEAIDS
ncbi:TPA: glucose-inhibited division protein A [Klebsiella pneumoniae]|nr:glucose-inhibited division protein A [Klebsiella pneumoniae]RLO15990.1 glucose-inhibited division protein A [Klebsiella pneumoniae]HBY9733931.1 glucose-inhibited division protein A [Klebsiella pneumoniae]HBY9738756.1 glucose-inhibited division protein A [Klebsiella pneumoniae]HBY9744639.1 glucose-inhibited division protein A [Klebsiella pneumoniae]